MRMKTIKESARYLVSDDGRVFNATTGQELKQSLSTKGYKKVNLWVNNRNVSRPIHRLVAIAYIPNFDKKLTVNHIDGNKLNNNLANLEWNTVKENNNHYKTNGGRYNSKLTDHDVATILSLANGGKRQKQIAKDYGVCEATISNIVNHKVWK